VTQDGRIARNNTQFREANEAIREKAGQERAPMDTLPFLCECSREDCRELVRMTVDEYANVRSHPTYLVKALGHEAEGDHVVVERTDGYVIVDKIGPSREILIDDWAGTKH
jgi:hypothetical protein